jgi:EAL domain-containing protein (putative c-di-GMP-specific phosphodiesterase class I)
LSKLPVDELKIDRSFIMEMTENSDSRAIVSSIIFLAQSLGLQTVAEGVETEEQLRFLQQKECDQYQGFFFSRPLPADELTQLLKKSMENSKI